MSKDGIGKQLVTTVNSMYADISKALDTPSAYHECETCGRTIPHNPGDGGYYTRYGWPKCCGYTMRFRQPALGKA